LNGEWKKPALQRIDQLMQAPQKEGGRLAQGDAMLELGFLGMLIPEESHGNAVTLKPSFPSAREVGFANGGHNCFEATSDRLTAAPTNDRQLGDPLA
jgi:hypothetical protein